MPDIINISILEDGTIKMETDKVSMPNHLNAENFLREIGKVAGGKVGITHKHGHHAHTHALGEHQHQH